jgi:hypothetical protein
MWVYFRCAKTGSLRLINMNLISNIVNKGTTISFYSTTETMSYYYNTVDDALKIYKEIVNAIHDNKQTVFFEFHEEKELK